MTENYEAYGVPYNPITKAAMFREKMAEETEARAESDVWLPINRYADKLFVGLVESISRTGDGLADEALAELRGLVKAYAEWNDDVYNEYKRNINGGDAE